MLLFMKNKYDALFEHAGQRNATAFLERMAVAQVRRTMRLQSVLAELRLINARDAASLVTRASLVCSEKQQDGS